MKPDEPTWEDLNAYADGELSDERAAEVAAALGRDPELADQLAMLHRLKGATQDMARELAQDAPADLTAALPAVQSRPAAWIRSGIALAAAVALVVLVGSLWIFVKPPPHPHEVWAERAWDAHALWDVAAEHRPQDQPAALRAAQQKLGPAAFVPDLLSAGLVLERVAQGPTIDGRPSFHLGYRGARGCRLSLFMLPGSIGLTAQMQDLGAAETQAAGRQAVAWQAGGVSTLLLAEGMDPLRFAEIARRIFHASLEQRTFDAETRQALQRSHSESERCRA